MPRVTNDYGVEVETGTKRKLRIPKVPNPVAGVRNYFGERNSRAMQAKTDPLKARLGPDPVRAAADAAMKAVPEGAPEGVRGNYTRVVTPGSTTPIVENSTPFKAAPKGVLPEVPLEAESWRKGGIAPGRPVVEGMPNEGIFDKAPKASTAPLTGEGVRPATLSEGLRGSLQARGITSVGSGAKYIAKGLLSRGNVGVAAALHSTELTNAPQDDTHRNLVEDQQANSGALQVTEAGAKLSDREKYQLMQVINSGDTSKEGLAQAAEAKARLVGYSPQLAPGAKPITIPKLSEIEQQQKVATLLNNAQAGDYADQNDRKARQLGINTPMTPNALEARKVPDAISRGADATDLPVTSGEGYLTGTDANGMKRTIRGYNGMPVNGITDTSTPEQKAQDAANRAKWTAESKAIDDRMAAKDEAAWNNRERMNLDNRRRQADYDLREMSDSKNTFRDKNAIAVAALRSKQAHDAINAFDSNQTELQKSKQNSDALKYNSDQGLRGHTYTADQKLKGDILGADATIAAAGVKAQADAYKLGIDQMNKNNEGYAKWGQTTFVKDKLNAKGEPTGESTHDPKAQQDFEKDVYTRAARDPKFLASMGVSDIRQLDESKFRVLHQDYIAAKTLTDNINASADGSDQKIGGMIQGAKVTGTKFGDWYNSNNSAEENAISLKQALMGGMSANSNPADNLSITFVGEHGKAQKRLLSQVVKNPEDMARIYAVVGRSDKKMAAALRMVFDPPVEGLRK